MTRRRWIADDVQGDTAALVGEHASHLARVLRAQVGQEFDIATSNGVRRGTVMSISDSRVEFALGEVVGHRSSPEITLVLAIFKFDRMEWAMEKCTEIGVARIIPLIAARTDAHLAKAAVKRSERWQRLVLQASEQSRRAAAPEITAPTKLKELCDAGSATDARIVLAESEKGTYLRDIVKCGHGVVLVVGPEGGWADHELQWFRASGWTAASLGDTILRAETAAIVATALATDVLREPLD
ncbi:MAG TPA: RsmE family RNA methyltransferase [Terriglobales bacterium]|nr:RsmE family RNA methyltransferase [Terriglobales bacterium]